MRLSVKIMIVICCIFLLSVFLYHIITTRIILGGFTRLEETNIQTNLNRALKTLEQDLAALESTGGDWAAWNETRDFVKDQDKEYIENNLNISTLENINMDFMLYLNNSGELLYSFGIQNGEEAREAPVQEDLIRLIRDQRSLCTHKNAKDAKTGIILLSEKTAMITAWPISNNEMDGPLSGTLVMGRYFEDDELGALEERTQLNVTLQRTDKNQAKGGFAAAISELSQGNKIAIYRDPSDAISSYSFFKDISGKDSLIVGVTETRDIFKQGRITTGYFRWMQFMLGLIILTVLFFTLQYVVLKPLLRLKAHVLSIGRSGDLSTRMPLTRRDEIGELAGEFDRMLEQLSDARNRLMEQSYYSGIGDMASGILHNIRNLLTPMIGQIENIRDKAKEIPLDNMEQAIIELNAEGLEKEREKSLRKYLSLAISRLSKVNQDIDKGLMVISGQTTHMEEALSQQDKFSHFKRALEPLNMNIVIEDAIKMMPKKLRDAVDIGIDPGLAGLSQVSAERIVLIQVITNLLNNASESILRKGNKKGNIWISGIFERSGEVGNVHVRIRDDGEGIDKADLKKIFNRGYSTKTPKPSGIGLHWCSNALSAMKADIYAESAGLGHGSSFHIIIPAFKK